MAALTNAELGELLARAAEGEDPGGNRERALRRAARAALFWPVEAASLVEADRPLTELPSIGPWLARTIFDCCSIPRSKYRSRRPSAAATSPLPTHASPWMRTRNGWQTWAPTCRCTRPTATGPRRFR